MTHVGGTSTTHLPKLAVDLVDHADGTVRLQVALAAAGVLGLVGVPSVERGDEVGVIADLDVGVGHHSGVCQEAPLVSRWVVESAESHAQANRLLHVSLQLTTKVVRILYQVYILNVSTNSFKLYTVGKHW